MHFNFVGFLFSLMISILAFFVIGSTMGFFASLLIPTAIAGGLWLYRRYLIRKPSERFYIASFGSAYYRLEVA